LPKIYVSVELYELIEKKAQKEKKAISDVVSRLVQSFGLNAK